MDTTTKHTPGPWGYLADASAQWGIGRSGTRLGGPRIATVFISEDNARLIASAPALLDALREIMADIDIHMHGGTALHYQQHIMAARAALRLAEGDGEVSP